MLVHGADEFGAVEQYIQAIVRGLRERDVAAVLLHPAVPVLSPFAELAGGSVRVETYPLELLQGPAPRAVKELRKRLRAAGAHVVHVADIWPAAQIAGRASGARVLVTHHTPELKRRFGLMGRMWWRLGWLMRPEVVYTSETDRRHDDRRRLPTHVVPLGIQLERFLAVQRRPTPGRVIGNIARLAEQKGHRYLLEALAELPDAQLVIAGDGELEEDLKRMAADLGVAARVDFLGRRDDVPDVLAGFDVFAFPSLFEGLCLAVIEAQAAGVPVVATPVGGIRETVVDGETGLLVPLRDVGALARAIARLLDDRDEAERLAANARRASKRYAVEQMVEATLELYASASGGAST